MSRLQEEITGDLAEHLELALTAEQQARLTQRHTDNAEAYQAYLMGRHFWNQRTEEGLQRAIAYFQVAIAEDPQ